MKLHRLRIRPLSPWRTEWQADTLAGLLCWTCARTEGPEVLERDILGPARAGRPPFVLSDLFPGDLFPVPAFAPASPGIAVDPSLRKKLKRSAWIHRSAFRRIQGGEPLAATDLLQAAPIRRRTVVRNVLNRIADATRDGGTIFTTPEWELAAEVDFMTLYVRLDPALARPFMGWMLALGETGFGADVSVGKGQFELAGGIEPDPELEAVHAANGVAILSTFQPGPADPTDGAWSIFAKYGRLGPDFGVDDVFKRPLAMLRPGACFRTDEKQPGIVGRFVPSEELVSTETARVLAAQGISIGQLCFGLAVPLHWPAQNGATREAAAAGPTAGGEQRRDHDGAAIVLLLDVEGAMPMEELRALLPAGASIEILRLRDFGGPTIDRIGARPEPMPWADLRRSVLALVQDARLKARGRRAHFFVHGMAPLPVFSYAGLLLSAWAGPVTIINRRKDGSVDVCPMQGRRTGGELFDVVTGLDLEAPVHRAGRVIVFVSTGFLAEADKLRLFVQSGGDPVAGLVEIRCSKLRIIDRESAVAAADELARHLSLVPSAYPFQKGIALVVAGPAQLALAAGRAVNPTVIPDVWIVNRGGTGPSGHELAFAVSATAPRPAEDDEKAAPARPPVEPPRIEELRLIGFRAFARARLRIDDFTALIGRNGAGKSTLLDAFDFLREAVTDSLRNALARRESLAALQTRAGKGSIAAEGLGVAIVIRLPQDSRILYGFRVTTEFESDLRIEETIQMEPGGPWLRRFGDVIETSAPELAKAPAPRNSLILPLVVGAVPAWHTALDVITRLRVYTLSIARMRAPSPVGGGGALDRDGGNLAEALLRVEADTSDKAWLIRHLAEVTPGVEDVEVATAIGGTRMVWFEQARTGPAVDQAPLRFHAGEMSDGTLRALGILLALRQKPAPSLVLIDEIEDSMHIEALHVLLDAIDATIQDRCQVLITSHSTEVLSHRLVTADRTRLIESRDGVASVFDLDPGTKAMVSPPDTIGSILRIGGLYPAAAPAAFGHDIFSLEKE